MMVGLVQFFIFQPCNYNQSMHVDWLKIAEAEIGVKTFPTGSTNPRITEYHQGTNIEGYDDKAAWCSSFVNWCFTRAGCSGTNSALARSWLNWGIKLTKPKRGCVVVLEREDPNGWQGHVGFFLRTEGDKIYLLGGNQLDEVREHYYPLSSVLDYRWPTKRSQ